MGTYMMVGSLPGNEFRAQLGGSYSLATGGLVPHGWHPNQVNMLSPEYQELRRQEYIDDPGGRPAYARTLTPEDLNPTPEDHMKLTKMSLAKLCVLSDDADEADLDVNYDPHLGLTKVRIPGKAATEKNPGRPDRSYLINSNGDGLEVK